MVFKAPLPSPFFFRQLRYTLEYGKKKKKKRKKKGKPKTPSYSSLAMYVPESDFAIKFIRKQIKRNSNIKIVDIWFYDHLEKLGEG